MYRIGVDVGGTNTDAAILDITAPNTPSRGVLASAKTPTTPDVTAGIKDVVDAVLKKSRVDTKDILSVAIGTTHFVNAVVEADARRLNKVAVVRLCGPFTRQVPPFVDFPPALKEIIAGPVFYLDGGLEIDGREIASLNPEQVKDTAEKIRKAGISKVALVGVFSPLDHEGIHEERCKSLMLEVDPSLSIVCSHSIGGVGLLERENATILNASILSLAKKTVHAFCRAMSELQLSCPLYLTQNDGTLTDAAAAAEFPIKTFASGPTNSMTGAAFLASVGHQGTAASDKQVLVVDVGGTTTDVCALLPSGFPRQAPNFVEVGGVRTAFSMPEVHSIGLGGGSIVRHDKVTGNVSVGPDSVGHLLTEKALVFGGDVMTATDIVVASGTHQIGDPAKMKDIPSDVVQKAREKIRKIIERAIDEMKVSALPVTVLLVGGGSILHMDSLNGVEECIIPPHHDSANAVGAAIAKVAGTLDVIEILDGKDEKTVLRNVQQRAIDQAVQRGADRNDVRIAEVDKLPLAYITNKATRFVVKSVGSLRIPDEKEFSKANMEMSAFGENGWEEVEQTKAPASQDAARSGVKQSIYIDIPSYRPDVRNQVWYVSQVDLEFITSGVGVLGTGGGGPPYIQYLIGIAVLQNGGKGKMRIISPNKLKDTDLCIFSSWYGAPSASGERLPNGTELCNSAEASLKVTGNTHFEAIIAAEIGGGNGIASFPTAVHYDIPVVDADLMGRAYPSIEHGTPYLYGYSPTPCVLADPKGNVGVVMSGQSHRKVESMLRTLCVNLGHNAATSPCPLSGECIKKYAVPNTLSQAWYIGRAIHMARRTKVDVIDAILDVIPGKVLYTGKIVDVRRSVKGGYTMGLCIIAPLSADETDQPSKSGTTETTENRQLIIPFQNEFLYAAYVNDSENPEDIKNQEVICTVPDLISILGQDGEAICSQELRYGLRVRVLGMPAHPLWTGSEQGLEVGGPRAFGLDMDWKSIGDYQMPRSVIDDFNVDTN
ncbi:hypothetical protein VTO42DRAFT_8015 [Malbranchea cinnamomea]